MRLIDLYLDLFKTTFTLGSEFSVYTVKQSKILNSCSLILNIHLTTGIYLSTFKHAHGY